ncbi:MAG: RHS repeat protein [Acidobacteria bacterium]|nr:RHS repeat protein [Acidobacteriota bacterium]
MPTEVDANFDPAGDDQTRGWLWTHQRYDWMGRVVRKIATDGDPNATENDSDVLISYAGCGCAGGVITTVQSEAVPRDDDPALTARRVKKSYSDILGRTWKTESFQWDGTSVFSTLVNSFDSRDQVIRGRQYAGTISSETFQDTTVEYDGFGRTIKTHKPGQETNEFISYNYNLDGSISSVVDGRGAITNNTYDASGLLVQRTSTMPGLNPDPDLGTSVSFEYDDLGNPTRMTDEHGLTDYEYNELGQLTAEVRQFSDSMPNAPISGNRFRISYSYTLSG